MKHFTPHGHINSSKYNSTELGVYITKSGTWKITEGLTNEMEILPGGAIQIAQDKNLFYLVKAEKVAKGWKLRRRSPTGPIEFYAKAMADYILKYYNHPLPENHSPLLVRVDSLPKKISGRDYYQLHIDQK